MSHEVHAERQQTGAERQKASAEQQKVRDLRQPTHAGEGRLVENLVVFTIMFVLFAVGLYLLTFLRLDNVWPMAACIGLAFLAYFIPQGIMGRADTGYKLAEGKQTDEKETSATVSS